MNSVKITFVGDIFPANLPYKIGSGIASEFQKHKGALWNNSIREIFEDSDIIFANFESPLIPNADNPSKKSFAGSEDFALFLKSLGVSIVSIANNHILEQGISGFHFTLSTLKKNGIKYIGKLEQDTSNIVTIEKDSLKIGFAAFSSVEDRLNINSYSKLNENSLSKSIKLMKNADCDLKVISLHWGNEYIGIPAFWQYNLAHKAVDWGADIIIGHHPHVVQPYEYYKKGVIFYSLGNFLFDMKHHKLTRYGLVAKIIIGNNKEIKIQQLPVFIKDNYEPIKLQYPSKMITRLNSDQERMNRMVVRGEDYYNRVYAKELFRKRLWNRLLMKKEILSNLFKISKESRQFFYDKIKRKLKLN